MSKDIKNVLETFHENGIRYSHWYTEDRLVEFDLGGADRLSDAMRVIADNVEVWCYDWLLGLEIKVEFDFERISISY
ncbi:MAG: hypothetical protein IJF83_12010 [Methanobrevibacter sp.]|nr:hypothetical protein [Methanobrevibacter sp.]